MLKSQRSAQGRERRGAPARHPGNDEKGNQLTRNVFNNTTHGYWRLTVDKNSTLCESLGIDETTKATSSMDAFTVDLTKHVVATKGAAEASRTRAGTWFVQSL